MEARDRLLGPFTVGGKTLTYDVQTGKATCPDGTVVDVGWEPFAGCAALKALLEPTAGCQWGPCP
jgi:hypothetical protein